ncbi:hypothetical protein QIS74_12010 [Colletotrichum tabaci]|uniref:Uncharacterized protein n=1 Tax=Colletotrichum tabaci TaxID=1209068 RepID=A0AAV9SW67_9PEZI
MGGNHTASRRFYTDPKTSKRVQLNVRPDIAYGLKVPGMDLNFGCDEPGRATRAFAIMEFKRKGMLAGFAKDLQKVARSAPLRAFVSKLSGSTISVFAKDSTLFLKQISSYCFSFRTRLAAMSDLDFLILFEFQKMDIRPNDTPVDVWNRGHGDEFRFTILDKSQNAFKPLCYNGFLRKAAFETPRDQ